MNQILEDLPVSERKVARYVSDNLDSMVGLSVEELALRSGSSQAAVVRFCKKVGCKGYRDFSIQLVSELAVAQRANVGKSAYSDIRAGDKAGNVIRKVCHHNIQAIEDTLSLMEPEQVEIAADKLFRAQRVDLYAMAASNLVAQDAQQKFMRINKRVTAYSDPHLQLSSASTLTPSDVAIALSWSGETREVLEAAELAKLNGAFLIAITRFGKVSLASYADVHFGLSAPEMAIRSGAMSSRIAQMTMIDILFTCVVSHHYQETAPYLERTRQVMRAVR
ncbi:MurR/RpiR family transcriptional regulator [Acutalibacter sp. 1XD8-33]|uniref:MurR/RpiR family transcriptional regulator n=1 Tax=Acutalibacter sp. 1XD8-33 TaxID=2320081 RepID=UPI000EA3B34B|nr:MurR/RpiR family transcriptional regulator [Acutalibacter sp. 1XD8-33]RKJ38658.1 MurR/RpiR family transcriptional regulator [Acutalibacter sp. 1XD8-33]